MPLDPSIIGSFRSPEVMSPVNAMAQMYQLRALQGESEKNQLAMEKSRRDMAREDTLRNLLAGAKGDTGSAVNALRGGGFYTEAADLSKKSTEADEATYKAGQEKFKYATDFMKNTRANLNKIKTVEDAKAWSASHHADPVLGPLLASQGITQDKSFADIDEAWANGTQNDWLLKAAEGTDQFATRLQMGAVQNEFDKIKSNQPGTVDKNGVVQVVGNPVQDMHLMAQIALDKGYPDLAKHYMEQAEKLSISRDRPLTTDIKNFREAQRDSAFAKFLRDRDRDKSTKVNVDLQGNAEQKARGEMLVDDYKEVAKVARRSQKLLTSLDTQQKVLDEGFKTGFGTGVKKAAASLLGALGVPEAEKYAANSEKFLSAAQQVVLQQQQEQKGTQTEGDRQVIQDTVARLGNTIDGNNFILAVARAVAKRDIEERRFYDSWYRKERSYDGAADAWLAGEGSKSLFDRPDLAKYKKVAPAAPGRSGTPASSGRFMGFEK